MFMAAIITAHADDGLNGYEYWIDSDYSKRTVSSNSQANVSFNIDLKGQEQGIHILNFRARNTKGEWGSLKRLLYYIPKVSSPDVALAGYEYWMDSDTEHRTRTRSSNGEPAFSIDISQQTQGIHFFNFRAYNTDGDMGGMKRFLYYIPEAASPNATVTKYEYWIDNGQSQKVTSSTAGGDIMAVVDISNLTPGVHYYNFRAQNSDGVWGGLKRMLFYVPEPMDENASIAQYEYWIDSDYDGHHSVKTTQENQVFSLDLSDVEPGVHYLNYRAQNTDGVWGGLKRFVFYLSDGSESTGDPLVSYLYRFNSITKEVPITACQSYTMDNQVFEIPDAEEFLKIDPTDSNCRFDFPRGYFNGVTMSQTSKVSFSIQFKNSRNVLSSPVCAEFELSNNVTHDYSELKKQGSQTFPKVSTGDFYAFNITSDGTPLYFKASQSCSVAFFDNMGNLQNNPFEGDVLKNTVTLDFLSNSGTYYGVVYNTVKDADNTADDVTIRLMTTKNVVPTPELKYENEKVTISCLQEGATLYYTTDGSDPTTESTRYTSPIPVSHNMTIKAIATYEDMQTSDVASLVINSFKVEMPVIQFANLQVYISCTTPDATIYYTLDGSDPTGASGIMYTEPVSVTNNCTVKAVAKRSGYNNSDIATFELDVDNVKVVTPVITKGGNALTVSSLTDDVQFYYTIDGTEPTTTSLAYEGSINVEHNCTVKVKGFKAGHLASETATLVVDWFYAALPVMSINNDETILTITCSTPGAVIYYELGGAVPTESSTRYTGPITLTDNRVVKAMAVAPNFNNSEVAEFKPGVHACEVAVINSDGLNAYLSTGTDGAKVYYTTDGTTPTAQSAYVLKSGSIALGQATWTVKAIVMKENMNNSLETTYNVPAYYDRTAKKLYTHDAGNAAEGFKWNGGQNTETSMSVSGTFNDADMEFFRTKMPNMMHLDLSGASISGNALPDNALAGMENLVTIDLPQGVTTVGQGILSGCDHLAAVTWRMDIGVPAPANLLGRSTGYRNLLLYVKAVSLAPASYRNVVQMLSGTAESITLSDDGGDFYCPREFTARRISYSHNYTQQTVIGVCQGWESIALPFSVQTYTNSVNGTCAPYEQNKADAKPFWLCELTSSGFTPASEIKANTPYVISMPNNDNYADTYILAGTTTFSAENAVVVSSESTETKAKDGFTMYVNYGQPEFSEEQMFALNVGEEYQGHPVGSMFVKGLRAVRPFECYMSNIIVSNGKARPTSDAQYFKLFDDNLPSWIKHPAIVNTKSEGIYNLQGIQLKAPKKGINIIDGKKMLIK